MIVKYIDYINRFWKAAGNTHFTGNEIAVFFYILHRFNKSSFDKNWKKNIKIDSGEILQNFEIHRHTLRGILDKIDNFTDVKVERVNGSKWINFTLKPAIENIQVLNDADKPVQQPDIENVQVSSREDIINYINKKIINIDYRHSDKEKIKKEIDPEELQKTMLNIYEKLTLTN